MSDDRFDPEATEVFQMELPLEMSDDERDALIAEVDAAISDGDAESYHGYEEGVDLSAIGTPRESRRL